MFLGSLILSAVLFALAYFPVLTRLSRSLASPYPKADPRRRQFAAGIDALLVVTSCAFYWNSQTVLYLVAGGAYLLFRDAVRGQSVGKFLLGLTVINLETGRPATLAGSVRRNLVLLLPGANVAAIFLEAITLARDPQGQRLGDRLAQTQVVEGLGAKDLVKAFQEWLMSLGGSVGRQAGRPRRAPVGIDR
jgi:uncharacterized RDD family membrane protein YckC